MKKALIFIAAVCASVAQPSLAQVTDTSKIVLVDMDRLLAESAAGKAATAELNAKAESLRADAKRQEEAFKTEQENIVKLRGTIEEASFQQKAKDFQEKYARIQQDFNKRDQDVQLGARYARAQISDASLPIVQEEMAARGANIAMDVRGTLASKASLDITNAVLTKLNAKLQRVSVTPPQNPAAPSTEAAPKKKK